MPDEDEKKAETPAEESEAAESSEEGDADQDAMMAEWEAMAAEGEAEEGADETAPETQADAPSDTGAGTSSASGAAEGPVVKIPAIHEVSLEAYAILGTASMPVSQLLRMGRGAVVELETGLGDEIEMRINDQLVAKGEVVVVEDRIAIEITEIVKREGS
jgi:flagellar motor switch protein FliN/FliY